MKEVGINRKKYDLHSGVDFIREMGKRYQLVNENGVSFGLDLTDTVVYIQGKSSATLADIILSATHTPKFIPSLVNTEKWLEEQEDLGKIFDDSLSTLKIAPLTKSKVREVLEVVRD